MNFENLIFFFSMLLIQSLGAFNKPIFYRVANGMEVAMPVLILYELLGTCIVNILLAAFYERDENWRKPKVLDGVLSLICGVGGAMAQNIYVLSFAFASPKLASMVSITVPALIYILNGIAGKENLSRSAPCVVKVVGAIFFTIAIVVVIGIMNEGSLAAESLSAMPPLSGSITKDVAIGTVLCIVSSRNIGAWFSNYIKERWSQLAYSFTLAALISFIGALVAMIIAVYLNHDREYYNLGVDTKLSVLAGCAILVSVSSTAGTIWCVQRKGTDYVAAFSNVSLVLDTFAAPLVLNGKIGWGSVIAGGLLVVGLTAAQWATTKEAAADEHIILYNGKMDPLESELQIRLEIVVIQLASTPEASCDTVVAASDDDDKEKDEEEEDEEEEKEKEDEEEEEGEKDIEEEEEEEEEEKEKEDEEEEEKEKEDEEEKEEEKEKEEEEERR